MKPASSLAKQHILAPCGPALTFPICPSQANAAVTCSSPRTMSLSKPNRPVSRGRRREPTWEAKAWGTQVGSECEGECGSRMEPVFWQEIQGCLFPGCLQWASHPATNLIPCPWDHDCQLFLTSRLLVSLIPPTRLCFPRLVSGASRL